MTVSLQELYDAGAHFGHQKRRWHPRMAPYIFVTQSETHIFDLEKTQKLLADAAEFLRQTAKNGGKIIFVGTKRQAKEIVKAHAQRCGALYITERWIGGLLTNFSQIKTNNIGRLNTLIEKRDKNEFAYLTKKERLLIDREIAKLESVFGGLKTLKELPQAIVLGSARREQTAVREAKRTEIPVAAITDTNTDPTPITYPIPANDDSRKTIELIFKTLADAVAEGYGRAEKTEDGTKEKTGDDLTKLELSNRSRNALAKAGITTQSQLKKMTEEEIRKVKGLGEKSAAEIFTKSQKA